MKFTSGLEVKVLLQECMKVTQVLVVHFPRMTIQRTQVYKTSQMCTESGDITLKKSADIIESNHITERMSSEQCTKGDAVKLTKCFHYYVIIANMPKVIERRRDSRWAEWTGVLIHQYQISMEFTSFFDHSVLLTSRIN